MENDKFMELVEEIEQDKLRVIISNTRRFWDEYKKRSEVSKKLMKNMWELDQKTRGSDEVVCLTCQKKVVAFGCRWIGKSDTGELTGPYCSEECSK